MWPFLFLPSLHPPSSALGASLSRHLACCAQPRAHTCVCSHLDPSCSVLLLGALRAQPFPPHVHSSGTASDHSRLCLSQCPEFSLSSRLLRCAQPCSWSSQTGGEKPGTCSSCSLWSVLWLGQLGGWETGTKPCSQGRLPGGGDLPGSPSVPPHIPANQLPVSPLPPGYP